MELDPREVMVLGAIRNDAKNFDKIKKKTNMEPEELNSILERLERDGLVGVQEKKGLFGKKIEIFVTHTGEKLADEKIKEMEEKWSEMEGIYKSGNKQKLRQYMDDNKSFLPTMMFFGIMDMMMFSMMFSMMGMAMSDYVPADQIPEGADAGDAGEGDPGMDDGGGFDFDIGF